MLGRIDGVRRARFWRYVVPGFALLLLVFAVINLLPAWQAAHGGGATGTLTMQEQQCGRRTCVWHGEFVSDDGKTVRKNVVLHETVPDTTQAGTNFRARDTGDRDGVYLEEGSQTWRGALLLAIGSGGMLVAWTVWLVVMGVRRRKAAALA
jgi:hypothetical protein